MKTLSEIMAIKRIDKWLCFKGGCLMRTKNENKEYIREYRFNKAVQKMREDRTYCTYCENLAETLHHKNEDHDNNTSGNLIPVCRDCHLEIEHKCDVAGYTIPRNMPQKAKSAPIRRVTALKELLETPKNCNTDKYACLTLLNSRKKISIFIQECSRRTLILLNSLGYNKIIKQDMGA